jgi:phenylacetaldehyde dehydrogenase
MAVSDTAITIAPEVQQFVGETRKMLIDGKWVEAASGKTFPVYNPATGEVMVNVAEGDKEDIYRGCGGGAQGL